MNGALEGRTAIVVGASSGIGRATALALAREGAETYLAGRSAARLAAVCDDIARLGGRCRVHALDVRDHDAIRTLVKRAVTETGRLNVMVNGAGVEYIGSIADGEPEQWREMLETNVLSLLVGAQAAIQAMRATGSEGHIVHFGSIAARTDNTGVYGATKAMIHSLTTTLRRELENDPIRIVNIIPGPVMTNFVRHFPETLMNDFLRGCGLDPDFSSGTVYPEDRLAEIQRRASAVVVSADDVARAVMYAISQPVSVNVYEVFVRPPKDIR